MCRIAAYSGPPITLAHFFQRAPHSLYQQSWAPKEMHTAVVNADGWGAGWFDQDRRPAVYRNTLPVWADRNLEGLGRSLRSPLWVGNVRSATAGLGTHDVNTQPFADAHLLFTHNGFLTDFPVSLRRALRLHLPEAVEADILGNTDSEHLFALIRAAGGSLEEALRRALTWIGEHGRAATALLNVIVTDGHRLVASRASVAAPCPSLYWHPGHPEFAGGRLIASEAFDDEAGWEAVPEHHLISLAPGEEARLSAL